MVRASSFFVVVGLAVLTIAAGSEPSCHMEGGIAVATFNDTDKICRINFFEGCESCTAHDVPEHNEKYISCIAKSDGKLYNAKCFKEKATTTTTTTTNPNPIHCNGAMCQMIAPYGTKIEDTEILYGIVPSHFTTFNDCRLGCQLNSPLCQSFTFGEDGCTWYRAADKSSEQKLIWVFNMGVQAFSFAEETGLINDGTVSHNLVVNTKPVYDQSSTNKSTCEETYAALWQKGKAQKTLGDREHLIGGFTVGGDMPKAHEWFGINVPLPSAFIKVSIFYNSSKCPDLQGISSDLQPSPSCGGKYLVANYTDTKLVSPKDEEYKEFEHFRWVIPPNAPGVFTGMGSNGLNQGALQIDENNQLTLSSKCKSNDQGCGLHTADWADKVELPNKMVWDFRQNGLFSSLQQKGCIKSQVGSCNVPLNSIEESSSNADNCDNGWQFNTDPDSVGQSSLQATREQGRCVFYKIHNISSSLEKVQQPPSTTKHLCHICAKRFGNFACVTKEQDQDHEHCKLVPSASFCRQNLTGEFCNSESTSCHMEGGIAVATFNGTDKICRINFYQGCESCTAHYDLGHNEKYISCIAKSDGKHYNAPCPPEKIVHI